MIKQWIQRLALAGTILALVVVVLGAYVRLSDAGLGCPDWPGCYGHIGVPDESHEIAHANANFPERPVEAHKAWKEMVHRYFASTLGLLVLVIFALCIRGRQKGQETPLTLAGLILVMVCFQGALGMWTVTLLVKPAIVTAHLFGGLITTALLWRLYLGTRKMPPEPCQKRSELRAMTAFGVLVLGVQIFLGGWVSTNYAALSCPDLPTCQGQYWPEMDFADAYTLWRGLGVDYEGGVLSNAARVATHVAHRIGAIVTLIYLTWLAFRVIAGALADRTKHLAKAVLLMVWLQAALGVSNVVFVLPISVATAHNGGAALLLLLLVALIHQLAPRPAMESAI